MSEFCGLRKQQNNPAWTKSVILQNTEDYEYNVFIIFQNTEAGHCAKDGECDSSISRNTTALLCLIVIRTGRVFGKDRLNLSTD